MVWSKKERKRCRWLSCCFEEDEARRRREKKDEKMGDITRRNPQVGLTGDFVLFRQERIEGIILFRRKE
jgi:hypothetical protein